MKNKDLKDTMKKNGIMQWQVADAYGMREDSFSRKMRYELSADEKAKIVEIIHELKDKR